MKKQQQQREEELDTQNFRDRSFKLLVQQPTHKTAHDIAISRLVKGNGDPSKLTTEEEDAQAVELHNKKEYEREQRVKQRDQHHQQKEDLHKEISKKEANRQYDSLNESTKETTNKKRRLNPTDDP